jgi:putative Holliday junction resolvase
MRILGIDYGLKRIGLAISDPSETMAQPLATIERKDDNNSVRKIDEIIKIHSIDKIVIGLPVSMSGEIGPQARSVLDFIDHLKEQTDIRVETWDERLSTSMAQRALLDAKTKRSRRKEVIDKIAAAIILQGYLDSKRAEEK